MKEKKTLIARNPVLWDTSDMSEKTSCQNRKLSQIQLLGWNATLTPLSETTLLQSESVINVLYYQQLSIARYQVSYCE